MGDILGQFCTALNAASLLTIHSSELADTFSTGRRQFSNMPRPASAIRVEGRRWSMPLLRTSPLARPLIRETRDPQPLLHRLISTTFALSRTNPIYLRGQGLISRAFSAWYRADHTPPPNTGNHSGHVISAASALRVEVRRMNLTRELVSACFHTLRNSSSKRMRFPCPLASLVRDIPRTIGERKSSLREACQFNPFRPGSVFNRIRATYLHRGNVQLHHPRLSSQPWRPTYQQKSSLLSNIE
jgi:hypothetical protein